MTDTCIDLTEDQFDEQFPLLINHLNPSASWSFGQGQGCLFETYGQELEFVRQLHPQQVWTLIDGDDGDIYLVSGFHWVNRIGYIISRDLVPFGTTVQVHIPMDKHGEGDHDHAAG